MDSNVPTERDHSRAKRPSLKTYGEQVREWADHRGGSKGAAGPCKRISPVTGEVIEVMQARHSPDVVYGGNVNKAMR